MPPPANPTASKSAPDVAPVEPSFEDRLRSIWEKNSGAITGLIVVVLLGLLAKGGWDYFAKQKELEVEQAYGAAGTSAELKNFIAANPQHSLAAVAALRIADEAYAAGNFTDATSYYDQAAASLKSGPLASRARLGLAMAKFQGGHAADGEAALKALANDPNEIKAFRAEAYFHLASAAADARHGTDVKDYALKLMQLDATSPWAQRAQQLSAATK